MSGAGTASADDWYGPDHWDALYRAGRKPWDPGGVPQQLEDWIARQSTRGRALVPGCGSAWEASRLADAGWDVLAVDFSPEAVAHARRILGRRSGVVQLADFFDLPAGDGYDLVYERAFLCALPPALRTAWRDKVETLLAPGGRLAGFFFFGSASPSAPPFPLASGELEGLLEPGFRRLEDVPTGGSAPVFAGRERWQAWARRGQRQR